LLLHLRRQIRHLAGKRNAQPLSNLSADSAAMIAVDDNVLVPHDRVPIVSDFIRTKPTGQNMFRRIIPKGVKCSKLSFGNPEPSSEDASMEGIVSKSMVRQSARRSVKKRASFA
jgi:hypothetical protein